MGSYTTTKRGLSCGQRERGGQQEELLAPAKHKRHREGQVLEKTFLGRAVSLLKTTLFYKFTASGMCRVGSWPYTTDTGLIVTLFVLKSLTFFVKIIF